MFIVQIEVPGTWRTLARFPLLNDAYATCNRAVLSEKRTARILDTEPENGPLQRLIINRNQQLSRLASGGIVIYEQFYNVRDDPDENWRNDLEENEDDFHFRWQEVGF